MQKSSSRGRSPWRACLRVRQPASGAAFALTRAWGGLTRSCRGGDRCRRFLFGFGEFRLESEPLEPTLALATAGRARRPDGPNRSSDVLPALAAGFAGVTAMAFQNAMQRVHFPGEPPRARGVLRRRRAPWPIPFSLAAVTAVVERGESRAQFCMSCATASWRTSRRSRTRRTTAPPTRHRCIWWRSTRRGGRSAIAH
jgi:hypothetical protein